MFCRGKTCNVSVPREIPGLTKLITELEIADREIAFINEDIQNGKFDNNNNLIESAIYSIYKKMN
jgi:hypothetical protein